MSNYYNPKLELELGTPEYIADDPVFGTNIIKLPLIAKGITPGHELLSGISYTYVIEPGYQLDKMVWIGVDAAPFWAKMLDTDIAGNLALCATGGYNDETTRHAAGNNMLITEADPLTNNLLALHPPASGQYCYTRMYTSASYGRWMYVYGYAYSGGWDYKKIIDPSLTPETDGSDGRYIVYNWVFKLSDSASLSDSYEFALHSSPTPWDWQNNLDLYPTYRKDSVSSYQTYLYFKSTGTSPYPMGQQYKYNHLHGSAGGAYDANPNYGINRFDSAIRTITPAGAAPDTTAPVITLLGDAALTIGPGSSYTDAGSTATDETDGDITANIVVSGDTVDPNTPGLYTIRYNVSDAAGNPATEVTRAVTVLAASITLTGASSVDHEWGASWSDPGYTATDSSAGDITSQVIITGAVDSNVSASYTLTYDVTGSDGQTVSETRVVTVADTILPVVTLNGDASISLIPGAAYTEEGASATDNKDGAVAVVTTGGVTQGQNLLNGISAHLPMDGDLSVIGSSGITSVSGHQAVNTADYIMGDRSLSFTGGQLTNIGNLGATPDQGTISFWIKPSSTAGIGNPMSTNGQSGNNAIRFEFNSQNKNKLGVYVGNESTYSGASFGDDNSMSAGNWYLITFTWDKTEGASGTARAYKDGVLESTHYTINDFLPSNLNNVVLGGGFSGAGERYYNGLMNGFVIHSRALSVEDIAYMYNGGTGRSQFTNSMGVQVGTHTVTYTATDAAGNIGTATRTIEVEADVTAPVITLLGDAVVVSNTGATYIDGGATAQDAVYGDLTSSINTQFFGTSYAEDLSQVQTGWQRFSNHGDEPVLDGNNDIAGPYTFVKTDGSGDSFTTQMHGVYSMNGVYDGGTNLEKEISIPGHDGETIYIKGKYFVLGNWRWDNAHGYMSDRMEIFLDPPVENGRPQADANKWGTCPPTISIGMAGALSTHQFFAGQELVTAMYTATGYTAGQNTLGVIEFKIPHVMSGDSVKLRIRTGIGSWSAGGGSLGAFVIDGILADVSSNYNNGMLLTGLDSLSVVEYSVTDGSGNSATASRTVTIEIATEQSTYAVPDMLAADNHMVFIAGLLAPPSAYLITDGSIEIIDMNVPGFAVNSVISILKVV